MALLELRNVNFAYEETAIVQNLDFEINAGQIISIMGPSGCGKSTVLRLIAGLEKPNLGQRFIDGEPFEKTFPKLRYSFQDYDAFPWKTVRQNLSFAGASEEESRTGFKIDNLLEIIGLADHDHKYPAELSGGMRKRLALGRCLAAKPKLVLLDEPFSSLDVDAKTEMYALLQRLWAEWNCVFVVVTHDIHEAILLSQNVFISEFLPFRRKDSINIPFPYPRDEKISTTEEYLSIAHQIRELLQPIEIQRN